MPHETRLPDRFLGRITLKDADHFIVMTEKEKDRLKALLPEAENIDIAPLPIYHAFKDPGLEKSALRKQIGIPADHPLIMFFGFIRPYKGLQVLIDAFKLLVEKGSPAHLMIVGEFWEDKRFYLSQI